MVDSKKMLKQSVDIVIHNSEKYRVYLDDYLRDARAAGYPIDESPYLTAALHGIYLESLNEAMWKDWDEIPGHDILTRICQADASLREMESKSGSDLHTPAYAAMLIYDALTGEALSDQNIRDFRSLDKSMYAFFDLAKNQIVDEMYEKK